MPASAINRPGRTAAALWTAATAAAITFLTAAEADAKAPGQRHCHRGICHRVMTLEQTEAALGRLDRIVASHYDDCRKDRYNPCGLTSSGEVYRPHAADNTASSIHPDGTVLVLRNPATGLAAVVRVNNFGPFKGNRKLDVSRATAEKLGFASRGVAALEVLVAQAPTSAEARYSRHRRYEPVPGFIGRMASIESAFMRYADLTVSQRIARLDAKACQVAHRARTPRLGLLAALPSSGRVARS